MKSAVHQYEDKLLEFAYGELARAEADAVEAHVRGCPRCSQALDEIRGVRQTMAQLPMVAAPDAGLDSLLAYAEQAAKRNATPEVKPSLFRRYLAPLVTVLALITVGVVGLRAKDEFDTSPASAAADSKMKEVDEARAKQEAAKPPPPLANATPVVLPATPQPHPAPAAEEVADPNLDAKLAAATKEKDLKQENEDQGAYKKASLDDLVANKKGGEKGGKSDNAESGYTPQSLSRRNTEKNALGNEGAAAGDGLLDAPDLQTQKAPPPPPPAPKTSLRESSKVDDYRNAGGAPIQEAKPEPKRDESKAPVMKAVKQPAKPKMSPKQAEEPTETWSDKTTAPTAPPKEQPASQPAFGLSNTGGLGTTSGPSPSTRGASLADSERQAKEEERKRVETAEKAKAQAESEQYRAPTASAPAPQVAPAPVNQPAPGAAEGKKKSKDSMSLTPFGVSSSSTGSGRTSAPAPVAAVDEDDSLSVQASERADKNDDTRRMQQQGREMATDLIEQARVASGRGDRTGEIQLATKSLQLGATGYTRVEALKRLCDAFDALGEPEKADPYCAALLREFPGTAAAQQIASKRNAQRISPAKAKKASPAPADRKAYDMESLEKEKPAEAAPAQQSY